MICKKCSNRMHMQYVTDNAFYWQCFHCGRRSPTIYMEEASDES